MKNEEKHLGGPRPAAVEGAGSSAPESAIARHTPGPWRVAERDENDYSLGVEMTTGAEYVVADVWGDVAEMNQAMRANAHLISSAPDLYEALKFIVANSGDPVMENVAKAALAKAEGR